MPTYSYECPLDHTTRLVMHMNDTRPDSIKCETCGKTAKRVWGRTWQQDIEPFTTDVGDGVTKIVRNTADARDIEKKYGVYDPGSEEWRRMNSEEGMRKRREKRQRDAMNSRGDIYEAYQKAEAEVKQHGREYAKAIADRERHESENLDGAD